MIHIQKSQFVDLILSAEENRQLKGCIDEYILNWIIVAVFNHFCFQTSIDLPNWLTPVDISAQRSSAVPSLFKPGDDTDLDDIHMYTVNG